ncbi:MAG: hypothetical protein ACR2OX_02415, partial [Methyloligellaceae bacterium]
TLHTGCRTDRQRLYCRGFPKFLNGRRSVSDGNQYKNEYFCFFGAIQIAGKIAGGDDQARKQVRALIIKPGVAGGC